MSDDLPRNAAGDVVGLIRQCVNAHGGPKVVYADETAAAASGLIPYRCDFDHWHVTSKVTRRPILEGPKLTKRPSPEIISLRVVKPRTPSEAARRTEGKRQVAMLEKERGAPITRFRRIMAFAREMFADDPESLHLLISAFGRGRCAPAIERAFLQAAKVRCRRNWEERRNTPQHANDDWRFLRPVWEK